MSDFPETAQHLLTQSLASPGETIILATLDATGAMVVTVRCDRTLDLVLAARSLLEDAAQRTQEELAAEEGDSQGDDPVEQRLSSLLAAIDEVSAIDGVASADAMAPHHDGPTQPPPSDPTDTPDLRARYDVLVKEVNREREEHARTRATLAAAIAETRSLRAALGLAHDAPPAPARNFGGG